MLCASVSYSTFFHIVACVYSNSRSGWKKLENNDSVVEYLTLFHGIDIRTQRSSFSYLHVRNMILPVRIQTCLIRLSELNRVRIFSIISLFY